MKGHKILFYIGIVIMIGALTGCLKVKEEIKNIEHLHFSYSEGYMMNAYSVYTLDLKDNVYTVTIKPTGVPEEKKKTYIIGKEKVTKLEEMLNDTNLYKWNGFKKSDKNVLDGDSFSFNLKFDEKKHIDASGYMMWPTDYVNIKALIVNWFNEINTDK
jgi:hypothetical protein